MSNPSGISQVANPRDTEWKALSEVSRTSLGTASCGIRRSHAWIKSRRDVTNIRTIEYNFKYRKTAIFRVLGKRGKKSM